MGRHQMPARGAMDGLRQDLQKAKDSTGYNPSGVGNAYSHNFLNQANFRNQAKVYEAEQKEIEEAKRKEIAKAEFQAEQEFLKTSSYLSPKEQQKFKDRQSVQFLYMKPPGADSMPAPAVQAQPQIQDAVATSTSGPEASSQARQRPGQPQTGYVGNMLGAMRALQNHERWEVRHVAGMGRSPTRGSAAAAAENQHMVMSDSDEEEQDNGKRRKRKSEESRLAEAEAVLREAGFDLDTLRRRGDVRARKKHKRKKEKKDRKRHREKVDEGT